MKPLLLALAFAVAPLAASQASAQNTLAQNACRVG